MNTSLKSKGSTDFFKTQNAVDQTTERSQSLMWSTTFCLVVLLLIFLVHLNVLCIFAGFRKKRRRKTSNILIAHMSTVSIFGTFYLLLLVAENGYVITGFHQTGVCKTLKFLHNILFSVFTLNYFAIIYERFRTFTTNPGPLLANRLILFLWIIAMVLSIPSTLTTVYVKPAEDEKFHRYQGNSCKPIPLFRIRGASTVYEWMKFFILHLSVVGYFSIGLINLRCKLRHLHVFKPRRHRRMHRKFKNIRFIYCNFVTTTLVWLPLGILMLIYQTSKYSKDTKLSLNMEDESKPISETILGAAIVALFLLYMFIIPFTHILLIYEDKCWINYFFCYFGSKGNRTDSLSRHGVDDINRETISSKRSSKIQTESVEMCEFLSSKPGRTARMLTSLPSLDASLISTKALPLYSNKEVLL